MELRKFFAKTSSALLKRTVNTVNVKQKTTEGDKTDFQKQLMFAGSMFFGKFVLLIQHQIILLPGHDFLNKDRCTNRCL